MPHKGYRQTRAHRAKRAAALRKPLTVERLRRNSKRIGACLVWMGARLPVGQYGYVGAGQRGRKVYVHILAWRLRHRRSIPKGKVIAHRCDSPACWNWRHLFLTTQSGNLADMVRKGRSSRGEKHWNHRITQKDVTAIRRDRRSSRAIAAAFGLSDRYVRKIRAGTRWPS